MTVRCECCEQRTAITVVTDPANELICLCGSCLDDARALDAVACPVGAQ